MSNPHKAIDNLLTEFVALIQHGKSLPEGKTRLIGSERIKPWKHAERIALLSAPASIEFQALSSEAQDELLFNFEGRLSEELS